MYAYPRKQPAWISTDRVQQTYPTRATHPIQSAYTQKSSVEPESEHLNVRPTQSKYAPQSRPLHNQPSDTVSCDADLDIKETVCERPVNKDYEFEISSLNKRVQQLESALEERNLELATYHKRLHKLELCSEDLLSYHKHLHKLESLVDTYHDETLTQKARIAKMESVLEDSKFGLLNNLNSSIQEIKQMLGSKTHTPSDIKSNNFGSQELKLISQPTPEPISGLGFQATYTPYIIKESYVGRENSTILETCHMTCTVEIMRAYTDPYIIYPFGTQSVMQDFMTQSLILSFTDSGTVTNGRVRCEFMKNTGSHYTIRILEFSPTNTFIGGEPSGQPLGLEHCVFPLIVKGEVDLI